MSPIRRIAIRRTIRAELATAVEHCDMVFDAACGIPRQGVLRAELEARRLARSAPRATPGNKS